MAQSIPFVLAGSLDMVDVAIQDMWLKAEEPFTQYQDICYVETGVVDYYLKDSSLTGLGYATRTLDNAIINSDAPFQGYDKTFTQVFYDALLPISRYMWEFGIKKRGLEKVVQSAKDACSDERERLVFELLDNGWATSYTHQDEGGNYSVSTVGGDGVELFSSSHTREDGGTNINNKIYNGTNYNPVFDYEGLKAVYRTASLVKGGRGKPLRIKPDTLVCKSGSSVYFKAMEILGAIKKGLIPESADHDAAAVGAFKVIDSPWLSNDLYYFMFDSKRKNRQYGLQYLEHQPIKLDDQVTVTKTKEIQYTASICFSYGWNDFRGWFGSTGAGS